MVDNLLRLEEGVIMYDATIGQRAVIIAPVMFVVADNPMASELCNHLGSTARKFCRFCLVNFTLVEYAPHSMYYSFLLSL